MIGTKIKKNGEKIINKEIENFDLEYVYIPVTSHQLKKGDNVSEGDIVGENHNLNVYSSVSGTITDFSKKNTLYGEEEVVIIKTNNKTKKYNLKDLKIDKKQFINMLKENSIIGLGGAGFPTYKKYDVETIDTLIINAIECEPYIMSDYIISIKYAKEIIDTIYRIMEINNIRKSYIGLKKDNKKVIDALKKYIKDKKIEIKELPSLYPMGWERSLIKQITNITYDKLPIEKNIVVNNISTIYAINEMFKGKPLYERVITITGNVVENPKVLKVKNGTLVKDILKEVKIKDDYTIIAGGPMMGKEVTEDFVITSNVNCILVMAKNKNKSINCLRCGKCINACPVKIDPVLIKDSVNNVEKLKKLDCLKCIECGLCSYVCPSNIPVRDYVIEAKSKLRKEKK